MQIDGGSFDPLRRDQHLVLHRARLAGRAATVLVLLPATRPATAAALHRLRHEHALARQLDGDWAARPLALIQHDGQPALLLEDGGGNPLAPAATGPLPVARFLRVATAAAGALRAMHACGLIHKDIKPPHLLVDAGGAVRLTGFGVASQAPRERQDLAAPELIAGTLAYMAPEQTGRMNRSVDMRSDLYALGVTFYEMLSGRRPFEATEPLEWVHCHVARPAPPLDGLVAGLPPILAALVMKLLSKPAEDRYQTAAGLETDLRRCLAFFEEAEAIPPFPLAEADIPDRLLLPERLYGRTAEMAALGGAMSQMLDTGEARVALVSGYSGTGKSAIVNELRPLAVRGRALMASGKCEQFHRDTPYATLGIVLQNVTERVLGTPAAELATWRSAMREALGDNAGVLLPLVPALGTLIGEAPRPAEPVLREPEARLTYAVRSFIEVFVQGGYPVVLFLDDLQWLDAATLSLLQALFADPPRSLLLLGAYRDNEVDEDHPLRRTIAAMRDAGVAVDEVRLDHLRFDDLAAFVADALRTTPAEAAPLARLVHDKSAGNPFFAGQVLTSLVDEGLVAFDRARSAWGWDLPRIEAKGLTDNVADLVARRLVRLPEPTRALLVTLACLGSNAGATRLALAHGVEPDRLHGLAQDALAAGLIASSSGAYALVHDRVQEAVHALTPPEARGPLHLRIARRLSQGLAREAPPGRVQDGVFDLADQYNRGVDGIVEWDERREVAALNLIAGRRARDAAAFAAALGYFEAGRRALGPSGWARAERLSFDLAYHVAECRFLTGEQEVAETQLAALVPRAVTLVDRAAVAVLRITLFTATDRSDRAIETCLDFLAEGGIAWTPHPGAEAAWAEYRSLMRDMADRPIASLLDLPRIEDAGRRAMLDVLAAALPPAFFSDANLVALMLCRMARHSLEHGTCNASPLGYAYLGMVLGPFFGDYRAGFEFGLLGRDLVEAGGLTQYAARVHMTFAYHVAPWNRHISLSLPLLRRAFEIAVRAGDLTYSGFTSCTLVTSLLAAGTPLAEVQQAAEEKLTFVRRARFGLVADIIASQLRFVRCLRGARLDTASAEEMQFEARLASQPGLAIAACWNWIRKLQAAVIGGEFRIALEAASRAEPLLWTSSGHFEMAEYHFHAALAHAGCCTGGDDAQHRSALEQHQAQLRIWAANCPDNFAARAALVDGAAAAVAGEAFRAMQLYEEAIRSARVNGLVHVEALAQEWAARFYDAHGFATTARAYLQGARDAYARWGAAVKVQRIGQMLPAPADGQAVPAGGGAEPSLGLVDLTSMIRTSRAVSGEGVVSRLIQTLMTVVLEHAGAERGLLLMPRSDELRIEAEARSDSTGIAVLQPRRAAASADGPLELLREALHTQETVLIDDARQPNRFSADGYLARHACRSVLCIPLVSQARPMGLLYLENCLAPYVFTPARVTVLQLLASQAAISLENATLEEKDALLKEMHHRVKNNLQLVSSLLNLQASRVADPAVAELFLDSRDRVRSMALVHENLYRAGDYARVPMQLHIRTLCAQIERAWRSRDRHVGLELDIENLQLDLDRAVSCGLIVNELVSNAYKHAFPGDRQGRLSIGLRQVDEAQCRLIVRDDGIGIAPELVADLDASATLGLQLVGDLVHQLRGRIELERGPGTCFVVTFPVALRDAARG